MFKSLTLRFPEGGTQQIIDNHINIWRGMALLPVHRALKEDARPALLALVGPEGLPWWSDVLQFHASKRGSHSPASSWRRLIRLTLHRSSQKGSSFSTAEKKKNPENWNKKIKPENCWKVFPSWKVIRTKITANCSTIPTSLKFPQLNTSKHDDNADVSGSQTNIQAKKISVYLIKDCQWLEREIKVQHPYKWWLLRHSQWERHKCICQIWLMYLF